MRVLAIISACVLGLATLAAGQEARATATGYEAAQRNAYQAPGKARPTTRDRFHRWVHSTYRPRLLVPMIADVGYSHLTSNDNTFDNNAPGFGQRLAVAAGSAELNLFLERFAFASLFHQDAQFNRLGTGTRMERGAYALSRVVVARSDDGRNVFNAAHVLATFSSSAFANTYIRDERRTLGDTLGRAGVRLASDAGTNLAKEFWPDLKRVLRRHAPEGVKNMQDKLEEKLPQPVKQAADQL